MPLTEEQVCRLLHLTPATLSFYVAKLRLSVTRKRTIRGLVVTYDENEVRELKREIHADHEFVRQHYAATRSSAKTVEAEIVEPEAGYHGHNNGANSSIPTSAPVIERLLTLLEGLTPRGDLRVAIERKLILTLAEAAAYSGLSEARLTEAIRSDELKARKDLGRGYRIKRLDLEAYVKSL